MEFNWLVAVGLFVASAVLDVVFVLYTYAVVKKRPLAAANWSLLTYVLMALGIVNYVSNKWYLIPLSLGAFLGSYCTVKYEARKK
jgi:hypothetical protein